MKRHLSLAVMTIGICFAGTMTSILFPTLPLKYVYILPTSGRSH
ncbi:hypothetical protein AB4Z08_04595 [Chitinophaga sp. RAB17]